MRVERYFEEGRRKSSASASEVMLTQLKSSGLSLIFWSVCFFCLFPGWERPELRFLSGRRFFLLLFFAALIQDDMFLVWSFFRVLCVVLLGELAVGCCCACFVCVLCCSDFGMRVLVF